MRGSSRGPQAAAGTCAGAACRGAVRTAVHGAKLGRDLADGGELGLLDHLPSVCRIFRRDERDHWWKLTVPPTGSVRGAPVGGVRVPDQAIEPQVTEMGEANDSAALATPGLQLHGQYW